MKRNGTLTDSFGRVMRDLRVSVTDRCNFRCLYCLPETEEEANFYRSNDSPRRHALVKSFAWKPKSHLITFEEIARVVRVAVKNGIGKVRLTGGEPLLRQNLEALVGMLSGIEGIRDLSLTTNGFGFSKRATALKDAGLDRVTISLDSLDRENFRKITGRDGLKEALKAIETAQSIGLDPVKVNAVIIRSLNDHEIEALAEFGHVHSLAMRFIEFMPLDSGRQWQRELVVPSDEILSRIQKHHEMTPMAPVNPSETACRWRFADGRGEIGVIAPVTKPFCGKCNRLRLMSDGKLRTCLFSHNEHDLKPILRGNGSDAELARFLQQKVWKKEEGHQIGDPGFNQPARVMSHIGG